MKVIEPGHLYQLSHLDGGGVSKLQFVCRESTDVLSPKEGVQTQEVLRALIDRTMHCDNCLPWEGNKAIIQHLRMALSLHEARALLRKAEKGLYKPELVAPGPDGHFLLVERDWREETWERED